MKNQILFISLLLLLTACNLEPREIIYGEDSCHYCSMTIVDRQHAAQLITHKGKVYKFDAAECMIHSLSEIDPETVARYFVTDYSNPEHLIDARSATFIISPEIPSPMRANLSALASEDSAISLKKTKSGELYSWDELRSHLKKE